MRLIVGLGNPGPEYARTPHNLGFLGIDRLAEESGIRVTRPECQAYVGLGQIAGHQVALAKPQTHMNSSGRAVRDLVERYDCDPAEMIVLSDDAALPWGMLRIREHGSAGGHNGLRSIIGSLGTDQFLRVRMGVRPEGKIRDLAAYVLCPMTGSVRAIAAEMIADAAEAVQWILREGASRAMSRFNERVTPEGEANI
ncbi:MAG: aminoacyl-tRNA hydrolase [Candidatus Acidiferrales bacterium]